MPGICLWVMVGMCCSAADSIAKVQVSTYSSICVRVGFSSVGIGIRRKSAL